MLPNKTIYQIDAFAEQAFKGNPAGVMIVGQNTDSEWMQNMAMEMNLSETAFIVPRDQYFEIRYFTPCKEVPLCGHASLASAHLLYEIGLVESDQTIVFQAKGGELKIKKEGDLICMDFPAYPYTQIPVRDDFEQNLGFRATEMYTSIYDWVIAVADDENEIVNAKPKFEQMNKIGLGHLMITARSKMEHIDFVVRCFAPVSGINEDPVTGSAHCALAPLWADKLGKHQLESLQVSQRTGRLSVALYNERVLIRGKAVTVFEACLKV